MVGTPGSLDSRLRGNDGVAGKGNDGVAGKDGRSWKGSVIAGVADGSKELYAACGFGYHRSSL